MQIFSNANYNFIRWRWHALALSMLVVVAGVVATAPSSHDDAATAGSHADTPAAQRTATTQPSTEADKVISGERSSWLTSEANLASRSSRIWSADAMSLNDLASRARSSSPRTFMRSDRWPAENSSAMRAA